jgi:hypothetical protein
LPEYDIAFAEKLAAVANTVATDDVSPLDAQRTVLYLSLLSTEISLKAMLERAGKPIAEIRAHSHRLSELLADVGRCEVEDEIVPGCRMYVSATRLRSHELNQGEARTTVGAVIDAEKEQNASCYPNQVRYGDVLKHFPAQVVAQMAEIIATFARHHWNTIRIQ